jgi:hypothetical protein
MKRITVTFKDWHKTATEQQKPLKQLEAYSMRWDEL